MSVVFPMSFAWTKLAVTSALALSTLLGSLSVSNAASVLDDDDGSVLRVTIDRAKVVRTNGIAETVIIGNPSIVDATIQDANTLILTGRSFGVTNLIILDSDGDAIVDETVVVQNHEANTVRIYRRAQRETLACSPVCEPTLTIGDTATTFTQAQEQITGRNSLSDQSAARR